MSEKVDNYTMAMDMVTQGEAVMVIVMESCPAAQRQLAHLLGAMDSPWKADPGLMGGEYVVAAIAPPAHADVLPNYDAATDPGDGLPSEIMRIEDTQMLVGCMSMLYNDATDAELGVAFDFNTDKSKPGAEDRLDQLEAASQIIQMVRQVSAA